MFLSMPVHRSACQPKNPSNHAAYRSRLIDLVSDPWSSQSAASSIGSNTGCSSKVGLSRFVWSSAESIRRRFRCLGWFRHSELQQRRPLLFFAGAAVSASGEICRCRRLSDRSGNSVAAGVCVAFGVRPEHSSSPLIVPVVAGSETTAALNDHPCSSSCHPSSRIRRPARRKGPE